MLIEANHLWTKEIPKNFIWTSQSSSFEVGIPRCHCGIKGSPCASSHPMVLKYSMDVVGTQILHIKVKSIKSNTIWIHCELLKYLRFWVDSHHTDIQFKHFFMEPHQLCLLSSCYIQDGDDQHLYTSLRASVEETMWELTHVWRIMIVNEHGYHMCKYP